MEYSQINFTEYKDMFEFLKTTEKTLDDLYEKADDYIVSDIFKTSDGELITQLNKVCMCIYKVKGKRTSIKCIECIKNINDILSNFIEYFSNEDMIEDFALSGKWQMYELTIDTFFE